MAGDGKIDIPIITAENATPQHSRPLLTLDWGLDRSMRPMMSMKSRSKSEIKGSESDLSVLRGISSTSDLGRYRKGVIILHTIPRHHRRSRSHSCVDCVPIR
ncbi:unnamed protein product [Meganyctiphanes norvegica]|uniref:Uncharacterized protein n=1 Tax=Meganyctiphanes norvegica TaxID=48144 RepID=A0AAV2SXE9_MEGNR